MSETLSLTEELDKIYSHGLPSGLQQHFVIVQPKWRLVCLAAFIRQKALERFFIHRFFLSFSLNKYVIYIFHFRLKSCLIDVFNSSDCKIVVFVSSMDAVEFYFALFGSVKLPKSTKVKPTEDPGKTSLRDRPHTLYQRKIYERMNE